jgi:hypothetical protein
MSSVVYILSSLARLHVQHKLNGIHIALQQLYSTSHQVIAPIVQQNYFAVNTEFSLFSGRRNDTGRPLP